MEWTWCYRGFVNFETNFDDNGSGLDGKIIVFANYNHIETNWLRSNRQKKKLHCCIWLLIGFHAGARAISNWRKFMHISSAENIKSDLHSCCELWNASEFTVKIEYISGSSEIIILCLLFVSADKKSKISINHSRTLTSVPQFKLY